MSVPRSPTNAAKHVLKTCDDCTIAMCIEKETIFGAESLVEKKKKTIGSTKFVVKSG